MDVSLRPIEGPWTEGYVLDRTLLASAYLGEDPAGRPRITTTRTEVGEALFQLKHRGDLSKAEPLARALRTRVLPRLGPIGFIVPMPNHAPAKPSNTGSARNGPMPTSARQAARMPMRTTENLKSISPILILSPRTSLCPNSRGILTKMFRDVAEIA